MQRRNKPPKYTTPHQQYILNKAASNNTPIRTLLNPPKKIRQITEEAT